MSTECDKKIYEIINFDEEHQTGTKHKWRIWELPVIRQILVMLCPASCMFSAGLALGTPTVLIPQLLANKEFELTKEMQSWLYSVHGIASWPAVITLPYLSQKFGRRTVYFSGIIFICISWILEYVANSFLTLLIAEILQGYAMGANVVIGVFILSEYSDPKYRGTFLIFKSASFIWGIWVGNAIGTLTDSRFNCFVGLLAGFFSFIILVYIPESPIWLAGEGNYEKCKNSFTWLRGSSKHIIRDFQEMFDYYANTKTKNKESISIFIRFLILCKVIVSREFYMPFSLTLIMFSLYQFTGKMVITMYSLVIVKQVTYDTAVAYKTMLLIDGISVIGMYLGCYLAHNLRRRLFLFSTTLTAIIIMFVVTTLLFLTDYNVAKINSFVVLGLLLLYSLFISVGPLSICTSIFAEIVPHKYKIVVTTFCTAFMFGLQTLMIKTNIFLIDKIGLSGIFCVFATGSSIFLLFLFCYLPETENKTLSEIEKYFKCNQRGIYKSNESKWDKTVVEENTLNEA